MPEEGLMAVQYRVVSVLQWIALKTSVVASWPCSVRPQNTCDSMELQAGLDAMLRLSCLQAMQNSMKVRRAAATVPELWDQSPFAVSVQAAGSVWVKTRRGIWEEHKEIAVQVTWGRRIGSINKD